MDNIFGAKATVFLNYDRDISHLAERLNEGLLIKICVENREDPPYDPTGMCETLGMEIWLNSSDSVSGYAYRLDLKTELCLHESMNGQMHDLSLWLARFITKICKIETLVWHNKLIPGCFVITISNPPLS